MPADRNPAEMLVEECLEDIEQISTLLPQIAVLTNVNEP